MAKEFLYCTDFDKLPGFPGCCGSCHDDAELFEMEMIELAEWGEPWRGSVCCSVARWIDEAGIDLDRMFDWENAAMKEGE